MLQIEHLLIKISKLLQFYRGGFGRTVMRVWSWLVVSTSTEALIQLCRLRTRGHCPPWWTEGDPGQDGTQKEKEQTLIPFLQTIVWSETLY
jgi:hypothetical protein